MKRQVFFRRNNRKLKYYLLLIIYRLILDISYDLIISHIYAYAGFKKNPSVEWMLCGWCILIIFSFFDFKMHLNSDEKISKVIFHLLFLLAFVPFTVMVSAGYFSIGFIITNVVYWIMLYTYYNLESRRRKIGRRIRLGNIKLSEREIGIFAVISVMVVLFISGVYTRFRINFNFTNVYDLRSEANTYNLPSVVRYLFAWSRAINTILIAYYFRKKKIVYAIICAIVQLLSFGIDGSKSVFIYTLFAIIINFIPMMNLQKYENMIMLSLIAIVGLGLFLFLANGNYIISSIFTRRVMFLPPQINEMYFDYFTQNIPDYYRGSILKVIGLTSPYENISTLIGEVYFGSASIGANNGLVADALANLGILGLFIQPYLYAFTLKILDRSSENLDYRIYLTAALYISGQWINTFYFTSLITHGILIIIIIISLMEKNEEVIKQ